MEDLHLFENTVYAGADLSKATRAIIMVHGRGDASDKMLILANGIVDDPGMALIFPKATNNTWYPKSFLAPTAENQPWLDSALEDLGKVVAHTKSQGIGEEKIFLLGFSQGACLALEYACRNAKKYAGVMVLSGGLIGPEIEKSNYSGEFFGTDVFIGCSDSDFHIPLQRLNDSAAITAAMGATVDKRIYPGMGHLINEDELQKVRSMLAI
jgi:phospholipase/carboxylesterase